VTAVSKLLKNRVYLGEARSGAHVNVDAHPAIVSQAEWQAAQTPRSLSPLRTGDGALLSGLLRCSSCRYVLKPEKIRDARGKMLRNYRCRGDHAAGRCPTRSSVLAHLIEPYIIEQFFAELLPGGVLARGKLETRELDELRKTLDEAERELESWVTEPALNSLGRDLYLSGLDARQRAVDEARTALSDQGDGDELDALRDVDLEKLWTTLSIAEQRRLLAQGIDAIILRRGRVLDERTFIFWRGQGPDDLPSRGRRVPLTSFVWPDDRPDDAREALAENGKETVLDGTARRSRRWAEAHA